MTWWPGLGRFGVGSQRCGGGGAGGGLGRAALPRCSEGEGAVVVGDAEVGEAREVDGCGSGGEPEVVGGDAAVGDASGFVAGEPRDGAFGHGAVLSVGGLGGGLGPAGLVGLAAVVVFVDGDAAPGGGGGAAGAQWAAEAERAEAGRAGFDGFGVPGGAGHGLRVGVDGEVVSGEAACDARLGVDGLDGGVVAGGRERVERLARRVGRVGQHQPHEPLSPGVANNGGRCRCRRCRRCRRCCGGLWCRCRRCQRCRWCCGGLWGLVGADGGHVKGEHPHLETLGDPADLTRELERVRGHYNSVRLHEGIGYVTPHDEHTGKGDQIRQARRDGLQQADQRRRAHHRNQPLTCPHNTSLRTPLRADHRDRVLGRDRVIQHRGVQHPPRPPRQRPALSGHRAHRVEDPLGAPTGAQPLAPQRQHARVETLIVDAQPRRGLPAHITAQPLHGLTIRTALQRLQHHHYRDHRPRHRRTAPQPEQILEQLNGKQRPAPPNYRTSVR